MATTFVKQVQHDVIPVSDLLASKLGVPFRIPVYQRGYAWERDQVVDLVEDLRALLPSPGHPALEAFHFFGSILTIEQTVKESIEDRYFELVDGQQRVTSFLLTVRALQQANQEMALNREAREFDDSADLIPAKVASAEVQELDDLLYLTRHTHSGDVERIPRLTLSRTDDAFFQKLVGGSLPQAVTMSHRLLEEAYTTICDDLVRPLVAAEGSAASAVSRLRELRTALMFKSFVVRMNSLDRSLGYRLFMVLNDRGKPLAVADLLRTRSMELLGDFAALQDAADKAWANILKGGSDRADAFLRDYYASRTGQRAPSGDLFDSFSREFFPQALWPQQDAQSFVAWLEELGEEASVHAAIAEGTWPYPNARASLWQRSRLPLLVRVLRQSGSVPLLLSVVRTRPEAAFAEIVHYLELVGFRYTVSGGHSGTLGEAYFAEAAKFRDDQSRTVGDLQTSLATLMARNAPDPQFIAGIQTRMRYGASRALLKYFLTTLDYYLPWYMTDASGPFAPEGMAVFDLRKVEIEHIYPQSPKSADRQSSLDAVRDRLGNLTIWAPKDNRAGSNTGFADKRKKYKESASALTRQLSELTRWTARDLAKREKEIW